jgi:hypothetical protein
VLGPVRIHVAERAADPLTVEAFVTTEATFALRTDEARVALRCRRDQRRVIFEAGPAVATFVLRLHDMDAPKAAMADGEPLPRLSQDRLGQADQGWAVDGRTTILKARAQELRTA